MLRKAYGKHAVGKARAYERFSRSEWPSTDEHFEEVQDAIDAELSKVT